MSDLRKRYPSLSLIVLTSVVMAMLPAAAACAPAPLARVGQLQTESTSVELDDAESVRVDINMGAGELALSGGAVELLEADFTYNVAELKPEVTYSDGTLTVSQPDVRFNLASLWNMNDYRYEWNLRLNDQVSVDIGIGLGAGRAELDLGSLSLDSLDVDAGAGDVILDLSGVAAPERLDIRMGAGEVTADLGGDWQNDLDATIEGGVGKMTLVLPRAAGVRVDVEGGLGSVNADDLSKDGDSYTNDAYGEADVTLRIEIEAGVGEINLELEPPVAMEADEEEVAVEELRTVFDPQLAGQLQAALEAAVNSSDTVFPGALMHVSGPDLGSWSGAAGLGNIETNAAMKPENKFRAGSIMKPFIAVVTLQLAEEGLFSLDDPMTAVLPENVTSKFANSDQITVRMLLNHTSGIPEWLTDEALAEIAAEPAKVWDVEEFLDFSATQEPYFAPGDGWTYSNTDYNLLGLAIEEATGRSWQEEVRKRVVERLGLENTHLPEPGDLVIPGEHARGYELMNDQLLDFTDVDPSMAGAAGGSALVTTAADLVRFLDAVLAGELYQKAETLDQMLAFADVQNPAAPDTPYAYALGLERWVFPGDIEMIGHAGSTAGYSSAVYYLPAQDITVEATKNTGDLGSFYYQLLLPVLATLTGQPSAK